MKAKGFFAYGSNPTSCGEAIEEAILEINKSSEAEIISWKDLKNSGN